MKMKCKNFFALAALALCAPLFAKNVTNGSYNFDSSSSPRKIAALAGDWEFYENQTFSTLMGAHLKVDFIEVPSSWSAKHSDKNRLSSYGCHTYRVLITGLRSNLDYSIFSRHGPKYAAKIYANGNLLGEYGKFSRHKRGYEPAQKPFFYSMTSSDSGTIELVIQVSNYTGGDAGLTSSILFGESDVIEGLYKKIMVAIALILGGLCFCFLSNLFLWYFDKTNTANFLFSLLILQIALRMALYNFNIFSLANISIPFSAQFKIQNLILFASAVFGHLYSKDKSVNSKFPLVDRTISQASLAALIVFLCLPISISVSFLIVPIIIAAFFAVYSIARLPFTAKNGQIITAAYMFFYSLVAVPIVFDCALPDFFVGNAFSYSEIFTVVMIIFDIAYMAAILEVQLKNNMTMKNELSKFYFAYRRFVPKKITNLFLQGNLGNLRVGLSSEKKMTMFYVGIFVISPDGTKINLREQFETMAFYSATIIEKIHAHGGSVVSISSQGISSLFNCDDLNMLAAAKDIRNELKIINSRRAEDYYLCVNFSISIHSGDLLVGIVGDRNRIDFSLVSSGVEVIEKMQSLGFAMNIPVLISQPTLDDFPHEAVSDLKLLGKIRFSEFTRPIGLYGILSNEEEENSLETVDDSPFITQREADKYINF